MVDIKNEIWKEVSVNTDYLVSNFGRVKSKERLVSTKKGFRKKKEQLLGRTNRFFGENIVQTTNK